MAEAAEVAYNLDSEFNEYVNKYIKKHNITYEEAMEHKLVKLYLEYLKTRDK